MKRILGLLLVALTSVAVLAAATERRASHKHFLGLWEGVDINDGSKRTISITDRDRDGIFEVAARDSFWTLCDGDRGLELARGRVRRDGVLQTQGVVTCFEDGTQISVGQTYRFSKREDTLLATPSVDTLVAITLHRVSE